MKRTFWAIPFLLIFVLASCNTKSGYKALHIYDYFKAKKHFEKASKKETAPAQYGLAKIYFQTDNPFHDIYKSYNALRLADSAYLSVKKKQSQKWAIFGCDYYEILALKQRVSSELYQICKTKNTIQDYQNFIDSNHLALQIKDAIRNRDSLEFEEAIASEKSSDVADFMKLRPNSHLKDLAQTKFYDFQFLEVTKDQSLLSYVSFIDWHPESPYLRTAQDKVFELETAQHRLEDYERFIQTYPLSPHVDSAWHLLYDKYTLDYSKESIEAFLNAYPEYPFKEQAQVELDLLSEMFVPNKINGKWGFTGLDNTIKIKAAYDYVSVFDEGLALVEINGKYGFINKLGAFVIPAIYDEADVFSEGLAVVSKDEKLGVIDRSGQLILPFEFEDIGRQKSGYFYASKEEQYAYYNRLGEKMPWGLFDEAEEFSEGSAIVSNEDGYHVIDLKGKPLFRQAYEDVKRFNGNWKVLVDAGWKIVNSQNDSLSKTYDFIGEFEEYLAYVETAGKYGYIDTNYNEVIAMSFDVYPNSRILARFQNSSARYMAKGKMGLIDNFGKRLVPAIFSYCGYWDHLIPISKGELYGYCNKDVQKVIEYQYDYADPFVDSIAIVESNENFGLIDVNGAFVVEPTYVKMIRKEHIIMAKRSYNNWDVFSFDGKKINESPVIQVEYVNKNVILLIYETSSELIELSDFK